MNRYRIGIIGGAGFIGFSLAKYFSQRFEVKILDIRKPRDRIDNVMFEICDIRSYKQVEKTLKDVDLDIHTFIKRGLRGEGI